MALLSNPLPCADAVRCDISYPAFGLCVWGFRHTGPHRFCYAGQQDWAPIDLERRCRAFWGRSLPGGSRILARGAGFRELKENDLIIDCSYYENSKEEIVYSDRVGFFVGFAFSVLSSTIHDPATVTLVVRGLDGRILGWDAEHVAVLLPESISEFVTFPKLGNPLPPV